MSLHIVDVRKMRERAMRDTKLTRAVETREIHREAAREVPTQSSGLSGLLKMKPTMHTSSSSSPENAYIYTEYLSGIHSAIAKGTDRCCTGNKRLEADLMMSQDVKAGLAGVLGGGTTSPVVGLLGAVAGHVLRHQAIGEQ